MLSASANLPSAPSDQYTCLHEVHHAVARHKPLAVQDAVRLCYIMPVFPDILVRLLVALSKQEYTSPMDSAALFLGF